MSHVVTVVGCDEHGLIVNQWGTQSRVVRWGGALGNVEIPNLLYDHEVTDALVYERCPAKTGR